MKCPNCGYDQKVKYGLVCGGCRYRFSFNPKDSRTKGLTDGKFAACIRSASQNDTAYFTRNQLYSAYSSRMAGSPMKHFGCGALLLVVAVGLVVVKLWPLAFFAALSSVVMLFGGIFTAFRKTTPAQFNSMLDLWLSDGKKIDKLIEQPSLHERPPEWSEPDIYDYGVERILIVERALLVDLFVKNGVHANERMLVVCESGYPEYLMPLVQRLLHEQPDLPVFLLHDATPNGVAMEQRIMADSRFPVAGHPLTDLGMFPSDFRRLKRTKTFDPNNRQRELPVDAMMLPFMTMGLSTALVGGCAFHELLDPSVSQSRGTTVGFDFG